MKLILILILILILLFLTSFISKDTFKDNFKSKIYNGNKWYHYRLGDVYQYGDDPNVGDLSYHIRDFPGSLAAKLMEFKPYTRNNKELIRKLIKDKNKQKLNTTDMVLHVRIGDVMCLFDKKHLHYSRYGDTVWWDSIINYIVTNNIKQVYIIAGSHQPHCLDESSKYLNDIFNFLKNTVPGIKVIFKVGASPDEDIIFASTAKHFKSTGGGYGKLIEQDM